MIFSSLTSKLFGGISLISVVACVFLWGMYKTEVANNEILKSNIVQLERTIDNQIETIITLQEDKERLSENINNLIKANQDTYTYLSEELKELNKLRLTEAKRAYEQPYQTGIDYTDDLFNRLSTIAGEEDRDRN